jgi:hypothetical protein
MKILKKTEKLKNYATECPVFKLNVALSELPRFLCTQNNPLGFSFDGFKCGPELMGSVYIGAESMKDIDK